MWQKGKKTDMVMHDSNFEMMFDLLKAQDEAEKKGEKDFVCPICGGHAYWFRSEYNNHLGIRCSDCHASIQE